MLRTPLNNANDIVTVPRPHRFAVVQMDPIAMVKHLNDPDALVAAQQIRPKKYLVYLKYVCISRCMPRSVSTD